VSLTAQQFTAFHRIHMPGLLDNPDVPREDWRCMEVADLLEKHTGRNEVVCEMCGIATIRYVHVMEHDNFDEVLGVCVACSERMTGDPVNPRKIEAGIRKKSEARDTWLAGYWYLSARDNLVINVSGVNMGVFPVKYQHGLWSCRMGEKFFKGMYRSAEEAKYALFEELWKLRRH
jgi:hypothetical protein